MNRTIAIDHGNRLMKTVEHVFSASYMESNHLLTIGGNDVLKHEGKVYILDDQSLPVLNDKTVDDRYFILTLFAVGKELVKDAEMVRKLTPNDHINVELLIGLPLQHFETFRKKFESYFSDRKAKGLLTFMLSVPDDWDYSLYGLSTLSSDGIDGVRSGIRELEKHGYLTRRRIRDAGGKLGDIEYDTRYSCPLGGDLAHNCAGCDFSIDHQYDPKTGECVRRQNNLMEA